MGLLFFILVLSGWADSRYLHSHPPRGEVRRPLLGRCSVAGEWGGSLCTPHGRAKQTGKHTHKLLEIRSSFHHTNKRYKMDKKLWLRTVLIHRMSGKWINIMVNSTFYTPVYGGDRSTRQTVGRWGWWRRGRRSGRCLAAGWSSPPRPLHALQQTQTHANSAILHTYTIALQRCTSLTTMVLHM